MHIMSSVGSSSPDYERWSDIIEAYYIPNTYIVCSTIILLFIIALAIYLIRLKRCKRFEFSIIASMLLKNISMLLYTAFPSFTIYPTARYSSEILYATSDALVHWLYVSQYFKTCMLIPSLV